MMLPPKVIDRIWARMLVRYGAAWLRMWEAPGDEAAKADWANELSVYTSNLDAIAYGLENLPPDFPPNVAQFKAICNRRPDPPAKRLAAPPPNPGRVAEQLKRLKELKTELSPQSCRERLLAQKAAGKQLSPAQRDYIERTDMLDSSHGMPGGFEPIPEHVLPPGMRKGSQS